LTRVVKSLLQKSHYEQKILFIKAIIQNNRF